MSRIFRPLMFGFMAFFSVMILAEPALAQQGKKLGDMTNNLYNSLLHLQTFLSMLFYILGIFFSITGLQMLKAHVDDPGRNPLQGALLRLGAAAFFIFSPTFANMLVSSIGGGSVGGGAELVFSNAVNPGKATGDGLDTALVAFVQNFAGPFMDDLLPFIAYAAGLVLMLLGLKRLALANGDGPQAPGGTGTMATFFVAAALMAFGYVMYTLQGSLFGTNQISSNPLFTGSADGALTDRANNAMWGVFIFLRIVGYISVLRGLFMLRAAGEGQNVSMMAVMTHMIAGAMLANATAFVLMMQNTFVTDPSMHILRQ